MFSEPLVAKWSDTITSVAGVGGERLGMLMERRLWQARMVADRIPSSASEAA